MAWAKGFACAAMPSKRCDDETADGKTVEFRDVFLVKFS